MGEAWHQHNDDGHPPPPSTAGFSTSFTLNASAHHQFHELTSDLHDMLHDTWDELKREIASNRLEKEQVLADFKALQERLAVLNDRLTRDRATRAESDLCIQATEGRQPIRGSWVPPRC